MQRSGSLHGVSGRRALGLVCGVALLVTAPAAAAAQDRDDVRDRDPVVVAGPQGEGPGARLLLRAIGRELCLEIGDAPTGAYEGGLCTNFHPRDVYEPFLADVVDETEERDQRRVGGAVRADVHFVEYLLSGQRRVTFPTAPAPPALEGTPAGELRYYLGDLPRGARVYSARLLDAEGRVLAEIVDETDDEGAPPLERPLRIASGIEAGEHWSVTATVESLLIAIRGDVTRRERALCMRERRSRADGSGGGGRRCFLRPFDTASLDLSLSCDQRGRHVIFGVAEEGQVPVAAVLGDGRRVAVRRVALPPSFGFGGATAWVVRARPGMAVRSLVLPPRAAEPALALGIAPPGLFPCGAFGFFSFDPFEEAGAPGPGGDAEIAAPGSPPLYVRDTGERELCLAPLRPTRARECGTPGPWLGDSLVNISEDGTAVAGAVDPRIRSVRLRFDDASTADVPTHAGERYTGRYAGKLAFFSAAAPARRRILAVDLLDEAGEVLTLGGAADPLLAGDAETLLRSRGVLVAAALLEAARPEDRASCLVITSGALPRRGDRCVSNELVPTPPVVVGSVPCAPRATVLTVGLTRGAASATAVLADGTRRAMRIGRAPAGERVGVLAVPPGAGVRRVTVHSRGGAVLQRHRIPVPPATRQCGYGFFSYGPA